MYFPPLESLLCALGLNRASYSSCAKITIPRQMFEFLLRLALESGEFNEAGYLEENPDVATAILEGDVQDARGHYISFGYFEGRTGATPAVDEAWYLAKYPDVALAIKQRKLASVHAHFNAIGATEGRSPSAEHILPAETWKKILDNP